MKWESFQIRSLAWYRGGRELVHPFPSVSPSHSIILLCVDVTFWLCHLLSVTQSFFFNDWLKTIQGVAKSQTRHFLSSLCIGGPLSNQNSYLLLTPFISFPLSFVLLFQEAKKTTGLLLRGELCAEGQAGWPALEGSAQLDLPDVHLEDLSSPAYISFYVTRGWDGVPQSSRGDGTHPHQGGQSCGDRWWGKFPGDAG